MTAPRTIDLVLMIRENDLVLLRSEPGVRLTVLNYDTAEDLLDAGCDLADEPETDAAGLRYVLSCPPVTCSVCYDWIGDDEPRVSVGSAHNAASFCMTCARETPDLVTAAQTA